MYKIAAAARAGLPAIRKRAASMAEAEEPLRFTVFVRPAPGSAVGTGDEAHKIEALFRCILDDYCHRIHAVAVEAVGTGTAEFGVSVVALSGAATPEQAAVYEHVFGLIIDRLLGLSFGDITIHVRAGKPQAVVRAVSELIG